ncbi:cyclophilin-like family protein [Kitasatospora sp. NBC_00315]|uniref:cyclophilin-like family protein n=1 Tax=Kitasatospora sp. NBC_00315 TaxID=2975963 RepID=UPI003249A25F
MATLKRTPTAEALWDVLPLSSSANTWGEEVYFGTPISVPQEAHAQVVVEPGVVTFWTDGDSPALPYGPTSVSRAGDCRLAGPCNVLGALEGDAKVLRTVRPGDAIRVERA